MKNQISDGTRITWTNGTGSAVASGDPVVVGNMVCVACGNIANGDSGELAAKGVFELPKAAGNAIAQGEAPLFDISAAAFDAASATAAAGDISGCCVAREAAAAAATTVIVEINAAIGTVETGA